jgi:hypothetical protein
VNVVVRSFLLLGVSALVVVVGIVLALNLVRMILGVN